MQELHKDKLKTLANDDILVSALEVLFYNKIADEAPKTEDFDDDVKIGQKYRAFIQAKTIIKNAILELRSLKNNNNKGVKTRREI